jgi:hypothetical protein
MTMALSPLGASVPYVLYATGTLCNTPPDSRSTCGIIANVWSGMSLLYGFSGCAVTLSVRLSAGVNLEMNRTKFQQRMECNSYPSGYVEMFGVADVCFSPLVSLLEVVQEDCSLIAMFARQS